ncbi:hypothetical protein WN944_008238 [Citrus x changshan-huyou]|uniref:Uncharacterized protein n=1 Tax=Citrus x changshan-huyou TaxID=2935761 RepID=A0AAP0MS63_9ROSI
MPSPTITTPSSVPASDNLPAIASQNPTDTGLPIELDAKDNLPREDKGAKTVTKEPNDEFTEAKQQLHFRPERAKKQPSWMRDYATCKVYHQPSSALDSPQQRRTQPPNQKLYHSFVTAKPSLSSIQPTIRFIRFQRAHLSNQHPQSQPKPLPGVRILGGKDVEDAYDPDCLNLVSIINDILKNVFGRHKYYDESFKLTSIVPWV